MKLWRSAVTGLSSTNRHVSAIQDGGHDPHAAGVNRKWSGSIRQHQKYKTNQLRLWWLPEQQQGSHLSWQSPTHASNRRFTIFDPWIDTGNCRISSAQEVVDKIICSIPLKASNFKKIDVAFVRKLFKTRESFWVKPHMAVTGLLRRHCLVNK